MLSNLYQDIHLFRFDDKTEDVYILAGNDLQNFEEMSVSELRAYVLKHRDDLEAIRTLSHHPHLKEKIMPSLVDEKSVPIEENIKAVEATLKQRIERENY
jgi:hypothetical protein|nr:hypothetical protein [Chroogloeocystis siderophila]